MIGKVWIFITAFSFITYIHHAQSECMPHDLTTHLNDELLEDHIFEVKIFPSETKENELLSVTNTLCSSWTKNKNKDNSKFKILETFEIMLSYFQTNFKIVCAGLNCTDAYTIRWVNATVFGDMYKKSCNGSISDLKCPSKSTTMISPSISAVENTKFFTAADSITTAHKSSPSLTTVSPNITAPENSSTVSSGSTENKALKDAQSTINTCSGFLVISLLLNITLFLLYLQKNKTTEPEQVRIFLEDLTCSASLKQDAVTTQV